jgi:hypothetical protein
MTQVLIYAIIIDFYYQTALKYILGIGIANINDQGEIIGIHRYHPRYYRKTLAEQIITEKAKEINDIRSAFR